MEYDFDQLFAIAKECGLDACGKMDPAKLEFMPEVRAMCAADKCQNYNRSWSCPPACGTLEEMRERCSAYSTGFLVQTIARMEDEYDIETMAEAPKKNGENFNRLVDRLTELGLDMLPMGAGGCRRCEKCTYPDAPCRFPDKVHPSMEACGLLVSKVCTDNDMPYYYGPNTIAYTGCILLK